MTFSRRDTLRLLAGSTVPLAGCESLEKREEEENEMTENWPPFDSGFLFQNADISHPVYTQGEGPGVLVMHELPGMTPEFWRFCHWLIDPGFTVYVPDLYAEEVGRLTRPSLAGNLVRSCISREIHLFARNDSSPVTVWLRALASRIHDECGGKGIGAVGMCMTGNFALSLVLDAPVIAPVASQPAMPVGRSKASRKALHMSDAEKAALREKSEIDVMALRFEGDPLCTAARFRAIEELIGKERFTKIELEDRHKNPKGNPEPHAILTKDLIDEEGSATIAARDSVISFLQQRLQA